GVRPTCGTSRRSGSHVMSDGAYVITATVIMFGLFFPLYYFARRTHSKDHSKWKIGFAIAAVLVTVYASLIVSPLPRLLTDEGESASGIETSSPAPAGDPSPSTSPSDGAAAGSSVDLLEQSILATWRTSRQDLI